MAGATGREGTINGLFPLIGQILQDRHGPGIVPAPSQATLYRLVTTLARPGELPSGPVRQTPASFDGRAFTPATALRPGEQVQVDTTRLDVLALFDDGTLARPELTIAVDVATRAILAAVLCPSATKAVDAALLLAEMAVPHPARPTWPDILSARTRRIARTVPRTDRRPRAGPRPARPPRGQPAEAGPLPARADRRTDRQPLPPDPPSRHRSHPRTYGGPLTGAVSARPDTQSGKRHLHLRRAMLSSAPCRN